MSGPATPAPDASPLHPGADGHDHDLPLADRLGGLPVAEHAAVLEAEHQRLHRQLATIDQL